MAAAGRMIASRLSLVRSAPRALVGPGRPMLSLSRPMSQSWQQYGIPGSNLPFNINNKYKLTLMFVVFFGTGFNLPFIVVAHQLMKR